MLVGITGAIVGYIIVVALLIWFIILTKGKTVLKVLTVAFSIYYAMGLYFMLPSMEGWPTSQEIPEGSYIISLRIKEPSADHPGAIYIWCNTDPDPTKEAIFFLRPSGFITYQGGDQPRVYKIPYSREVHKQIAEAQKKKQKVGGWVEFSRRKKGRGKGRNDPESSSNFQVVNPIEILTKGDNPQDQP